MRQLVASFTPYVILASQTVGWIVQCFTSPPTQYRLKSISWMLHVIVVLVLAY